MASDEWNKELREKMESAHGYHALGMHTDAWSVLDDLSPEEKAHPLVALLRLDILLALHRYDDAVVLGTGACRQWPIIEGFFFKTVTALMRLGDHQKAKDLLLAGPESLRQKAVYWYDLACCQCKLGEVHQAKLSIIECCDRDRNLREQALIDPDLELIW